MKNILILLLLLATPYTTAFAQAISPKYVPGFTVSATVQLKANTAGELEVVPGSYVIGGAITPGPITPGPDPIIPGPTVDRVKQIRDSAIKVNDPQTSKNLGALYLGIADQVRQNKYQTVEILSDTVKQATDLFLSLEPNAKTKWQPTRDIFQAQWTLVQQLGGGLQDYAKLLEDAGNGFDTASPNAEVINPIAIINILQILSDGTPFNLAKIIKLLPLILQLFAFGKVVN